MGLAQVKPKKKSACWGFRQVYVAPMHDKSLWKWKQHERRVKNAKPKADLMMTQQTEWQRMDAVRGKSSRSRACLKTLPVPLRQETMPQQSERILFI